MLKSADQQMLATYMLRMRNNDLEIRIVAPLVARNKMKRPHLRYPPSLPMSRGISGGRQVIKVANTSNRGCVCLFYQIETTI